MVLTTIPPIHSFTACIAPESIEVKQLLSSAQGPHGVSLTPDMLKLLHQADLVVMNGLGLEPWIEKAMHGEAAKKLVDASHGIDLPDLPGFGGSEHAWGDGHGVDGHEHGGRNPHIWLDPLLAIEQVENISEALRGAYPEHGDVIERRTLEFTGRLWELHEELVRNLRFDPPLRIITFHNAFPYFAKRYGIDIAGVFHEFPGNEPTPRELGGLRELIQEGGVRALFAEPWFSSNLLDSMAEDLKVPVGILDPMGTGTSGKDFYIERMRDNMEALVNAHAR